MPVTTKVTLADALPLTCSRSGTCCHGKTVRLNPWELACLAEAKGMTPRAFRDRYCDLGGIQLRFDGAPGWRQQPSCSQYVPGFGCSAHAGRPLACRLYPLGRQRQSGELHYMHEGSEFPCVEGCPEVLGMPLVSVAAYIEEQGTKRFEAAQDEYLEVMQSLADSAFAILLESGLAESDGGQTVRLWREIGGQDPGQVQARLGSGWIDALMLPGIRDGLQDPAAFSRMHNDLLLEKAQEAFGALDSVVDLSRASAFLMGLALHLGRGLGADPAALAEHWIRTAKEQGARE